MTKILTLFVLLSMNTAAAADGFKIDFVWDGLELCTSGQPNIVGNPSFTLANVPEGTEIISFKLVDLDVPQYPHGGGDISYVGEEKTPEGVFTYKSPCPPNGQHQYEWTAEAKDSQDRVLGVASMIKAYP